MDLQPQDEAGGTVCALSPESLRYGSSRQLSKLLLDKFDPEKLLTDQCLTCSRDLKISILYVEQASIGDEPVVTAKLQGIRKRLEENRFRLDIWMADCSVLEGPYLNNLGEEIDKVATCAFSAIHQQLSAIAGDVDQLWSATYGKNSQGEVYNNLEGVARLQKACGIVIQQLRVLAEMQTSIQRAQAIQHQIGPQAHLRKQIVAITNQFNAVEDESGADEESCGYVADDSVSHTAMEEKCDNCQNVFILGALDFHHEICDKHKLSETRPRPFERAPVASAMTADAVEVLQEPQAALVSSTRNTRSNTLYCGSSHFHEDWSSNESPQTAKTADAPAVTSAPQPLHYQSQQHARESSAYESKISLDSARPYTPTLIGEDDVSSKTFDVSGFDVLPDASAKISSSSAVRADQLLYSRDSTTPSHVDLLRTSHFSDSQITLPPDDFQLQTAIKYPHEYRRHLNNLEISAQAFEGEVRALQNVLANSDSRIRSISSDVQLFLGQIENHGGDTSKIDLNPQSTWLNTRLGEILSDFRTAQSQANRAIGHVKNYQSRFLDTDIVRKTSQSQFTDAEGSSEILTHEALVELRISNRLAATQSEIADKENEIIIKMNEANAKRERKRQLDTEVYNKNCRIRKAESEKERKTGSAIVGSGIGLLGVALAPFTAGASLALTVGAGVGVGVNFAEISNLNIEIQAARSAIAQLQIEIVQAYQDISTLEEQRHELQRFQSNTAALRRTRQEYRNQIQSEISMLNDRASSIISTFERSRHELLTIKQNLATCSALLIECSLDVQTNSDSLKRFLWKKYQRKQEFKRQMTLMQNISEALDRIHTDMPALQPGQDTTLLTLEPWTASTESVVGPPIPKLCYSS